ADVGFAAASTAFLNDRRCTDREAALVENSLVSVLIDFSCSPGADTRHSGVLQVRIDVEPLRASALRPKPATINLVLKQMPLPAVVEINCLFVRPRRGNPIVRDEFFLAQETVDQPVPVHADRIARTDRLIHEA